MSSQDNENMFSRLAKRHGGEDPPILDMLKSHERPDGCRVVELRQSFSFRITKVRELHGDFVSKIFRGQFTVRK